MLKSHLRRAAASALVIVCATGVSVLVATPASASPAGLVMVSATSSEDSVDYKSASAVCPAGKKVLGGGAQAFTWSTAGLVITQAYPNSTGNSFVAAAWEDEDRTTEVWYVKAYAICANPLPGLEYVSTPWYTGIDGTWSVCSTGKKLIGSGGQVTGGSGQVALSGVFPAGSGTPSRSETWVTEDHNGWAGTYQVRSTSVCADPILGLTRVIKSVPDTTGIGAWATCPSGKKVLSSGARLGSSDAASTVWQGEAKFSLMAPNSALTSSYISAEQYLDSGETFTAQAIAMCA